jgi:FkbM family methyltransferase
MSDVGKFSRLVRQHVGDPAIIFEFGARDCGETLALVGEFPGARIFSFECNQATLPLCRERVAGRENITLVDSAVGEMDGMTTFYPIDPHETLTTWPDGNPGASSLFRATGKYELETYVQGMEQVPIVRPDTFMERNGIPAVDALWMDIQGAELMALKGFGRHLQRVGLISLEAEFVEIYQKQPLFRDVDAFLRRNGFVLAGFLSLGRFSCDAVYVRHGLAGCGLRWRAPVWRAWTYWKTSFYYPLRRHAGRLLRGMLNFKF